MVLYKAFDWQPPVFAHVSLLLNPAKAKLSKRIGGHEIQSLRAQGILPQALVNHLALLGWSHRLSDDFIPLQDLIKAVSARLLKPSQD